MRRITSSAPLDTHSIPPSSRGRYHALLYRAHSLRLPALLRPAQLDVTGPKAVNKGVELVVDVEEELESMTLLGDAFRLRQCLINLSDNCTKFSTDGEVSVLTAHTAWRAPLGVFWSAPPVLWDGMGL